MTSFDQCPRCNGKWIQDSKYESEVSMDCSDCKMIWLPKENVCWHYFSKDETIYLLWDLDNNVCHYMSSPITTEQVMTKLPMLPFDIKFKKLKLYILFS
jgi:hypothetical protein